MALHRIELETLSCCDLIDAALHKDMKGIVP